MSPILVRPVREQFEHDRIIRVLHLRYKRKYEVVVNPGMEQNASVAIGDLPMYPDLLLFTSERGRRLQGTVEVETSESINTLEAMAQWGPFSRLRVPFVLYVPLSGLDTARRLCAEHQVSAAEIWTYHINADQVRFTMVHRAPEAQAAKTRAAARESAKRPAAKPAAKRTAAPKASLRGRTATAAKQPAGRKKPSATAGPKRAGAAKATRAAKSKSRAGRR
ncbi:MAG: hypothetical protein ACT4QD_22785 [Acidobacteriota bacterium]